MLTQVTRKQKGIQGTCDVCDTSTEIFLTRGGIKMCQECIDKETETLKTVYQEQEMKDLLNKSRKIDTAIELKRDIFNANTVAAVELLGAIMADNSIKPENKEYTYALACKERMLHHQKVLFDKKQEVIEAENIAQMWQAQTQTAASKVRDERREHFKNLNMNYSPKVVKEIKPKAIKSPRKAKIDTDEARREAAKYGLDASTVIMMAQVKHISAAQAAEMYARQLGLIK